MSTIPHSADRNAHFSQILIQLRHIFQFIGNVDNYREAEPDPELRDTQLEQILNELQINKEELRHSYDHLSLALSLHFRLVARLNSRRDQLAAERERALAAPIRALPHEIFSEIFIWAHEDGVKRSILGTVCRSWRQIASRTPQLWRVINLASLEMKKLALTERRLQLAGNVLLDITISAPMANTRPGDEIELHRALVGYGVHRWRSLIIGESYSCYGYPENHLRGIYRGELSSLHTFGASVVPHQSLHPLLAMVSRAPLKVLDMVDAIDSLPYFDRRINHFTNLTAIMGSLAFMTTINLSTSLSAIHMTTAKEEHHTLNIERFDNILTAVIEDCQISFLQRFPNLTKLRVHLVNWYSPNHIIMPHLRWLQIESTSLKYLSQIVAPNVEILDLWETNLSGSTRSYDRNHNVISAFNNNITMRPKSLSFHFNVAGSVLKKVLSVWPQLEDIELNLGRGFQWRKKAFTSTLTQVKSRGRGPTICPNLTKLMVMCWGCKYDADEWYALVQRTLAARPALKSFGSYWDDIPAHYQREGHEASFLERPEINI